MKLIKLSADHFVIVDDSEIKEDCYALPESPLGEREIVTANGQCKLDRRITHSTYPIEYTTEDHLQWDKIKRLSLSEVKELIGEVDVENKAIEWYNGEPKYNSNYVADPYSWKEGYNQSLEDNKDKKYTEEDMRIAIRVATTSKYDHILVFYSEEEILKSIQPKTQWEVEFIDGKLKLK